MATYRIAVDDDRDLSSDARFVVRRDWNFAEVEFGGHGSVIVRWGCYVGKKAAMPLLAKFQTRLTTNARGDPGTAELQAPRDVGSHHIFTAGYNNLLYSRA